MILTSSSWGNAGCTVHSQGTPKERTTTPKLHIEVNGTHHMPYTGMLLPTEILCREALTSLWRLPRWLPCGDWSKMFEMTQSSAGQNLSCAAMSAKPPGVSTPMLADAPSEARVTLYRGPLYLTERSKIEQNRTEIEQNSFSAEQIKQNSTEHKGGYKRDKA